jgi:histidine triad (HIT) family protein
MQNYTGNDFYCDIAIPRKIDLKVEHEDDFVLAYHHTKPHWTTHIVVTPKKHISSFTDRQPGDDEIILKVLDIVKMLAKKVEEEKGECRILTNLGNYQDSKHLHIHISSGPAKTTFKPYRFSPIKRKDEMMEAIKYLHIQSYKMCKTTFDRYLDISGNIGIFCHYDEEYNFLKTIQAEMCYPSEDKNTKYFELREPIVFEEENSIPRTTYTHLYIRKPDIYRSQVGDIDFYLPEQEYQKLKQEMLDGKVMKDARIFPRPDLDMIELFNPDIDVLTYVSTLKMSEKVRLKISEHINL